MEQQVAGGPLPAWLVYAVGVVAVVNFIAYVAGAFYFGGDAVNGHQEAGRYYLSMNGRLTEACHAVYRYSIWHTISLFVTFLLAMIFWLVATRTRKARG